jgi:hypothetical protein
VVAFLFPFADAWDALGNLILVLFVASLVIGLVLGVGLGVGAAIVLRIKRAQGKEKTKSFGEGRLGYPIAFLQDLFAGTFTCGVLGGVIGGLRYGFYSTSVRDYSLWGVTAGLLLSTSLQLIRHMGAYHYLRRSEIVLACLCAGLLVGFALARLLGGGMFAFSFCIPFGAATGLSAGLASLAPGRGKNSS